MDSQLYREQRGGVLGITKRPPSRYKSFTKCLQIVQSHYKFILIYYTHSFYADLLSMTLLFGRGAHPSCPRTPSSAAAVLEFVPLFLVFS